MQSTVKLYQPQEMKHQHKVKHENDVYSLKGDLCYMTMGICCKTTLSHYKQNVDFPAVKQIFLKQKKMSAGSPGFNLKKSQMWQNPQSPNSCTIPDFIMLSRKILFSLYRPDSK